MSHRSKLHQGSAICAAMIVNSVVWSSNAHAGTDDPAFINIGAGYYDIFDDDNATELRLEYRAETKYWIFKPFAGITATSDSAAFGYAGVLTDYYFDRRIVVTPSIAAGYYHNGDGKDLGHEFEIKSGLEIAYRLNDRSRLGIHFHHISNAGFENTKPGVEILGINYSVPLR